MALIFFIINYCFAVFFLTLCIFTILNESATVAFPLLIIAIICFPETKNYLETKINKVFLLRYRIILGIVLSFSSTFLSQSLDAQRKIDSFYQNKTSILNQLKKDISEESFKNAIELSNQYIFTNDFDIVNYKDRAEKGLEHQERYHQAQEKLLRIKSILATIKDLPEKEISEKIELYQELIELDPQNFKYQQQLSFLVEQQESLERQRIVKEKAEQARAEQARAEQAREEEERLAKEREEKEKNIALERENKKRQIPKFSEFNFSAIKRAIINQSIDSYRGNCPCPYNVMANGRSCGGRSAYSREGGESPICYEEDITNEMVQNYR